MVVYADMNFLMRKRILFVFSHKLYIIISLTIHLLLSVDFRTRYPLAIVGNCIGVKRSLSEKHFIDLYIFLYTYSYSYKRFMLNASGSITIVNLINKPNDILTSVVYIGAKLVLLV